MVDLESAKTRARTIGIFQLQIRPKLLCDSSPDTHLFFPPRPRLGFFLWVSFSRINSGNFGSTRAAYFSLPSRIYRGLFSNFICPDRVRNPSRCTTLTNVSLIRLVLKLFECLAHILTLLESSRHVWPSTRLRSLSRCTSRNG